MRPAALLLLWLVALLLTGCEEAATKGGKSVTLPPAQPEGWDRAIAPTRAVDLDPDPTVVEIELTAKVVALELLPGKKTELWTYNGSLPGPLIEAHVGDLLIVRLTNELPEATTIHWHGLRVPNEMDGTPRTQAPIEPGETFEYRFEVPDAGTFWYHPHLRSNVQVGNGLYAPLVVRDRQEPTFADEVTLVVDDVQLEEDGSLAAPDSGGNLGDYFGREGNVLLVNGRVLPEVRARAGLPQRWRLINASNSRYFHFRLPGKVVQVGSDGGLLEAPRTLDAIVMTPGERLDVVWTPSGEPGTRTLVNWENYDRGYYAPRNPEDLLRVSFVNEPPVSVSALPATLRSIERLSFPEGGVIQQIDLTERAVDGLMELGVNGIAHHAHVTAHVGETQLWAVTNTTEASHPFHLHGFFFQQADERGQVIDPTIKDTIDVRYGTTKHLLVHFDDRPGEWMFHCHILDHAELGMMGHLLVEP